MALDIYRLSDKKREKKIYSLDEASLASMSEIFSEFKKRTGIDIDSYGDNRIYCDHLELISTLISSKKDPSKNIDKRILAFKDFLDKEVKGREDLLMVGD